MELPSDVKRIWPEYATPVVDMALAVPLLLWWMVHAFKRKKKGKKNR